MVARGCWFLWEETGVPGEYPRGRAGDGRPDIPTYDIMDQTLIALVRSEYVTAVLNHPSLYYVSIGPNNLIICTITNTE